MQVDFYNKSNVVIVEIIKENEPVLEENTAVFMRDWNGKWFEKDSYSWEEVSWSISFILEKWFQNVYKNE